MKPTDLLPDLGKPVAYYPELVKITGSVTAALFLCQFLYWDGKQKDKRGWIYKTQRAIEEETGLSRWEQQTARRVLLKRGFIRQKYAGMPRTVHYRVMKKALWTAWRDVKGLSPQHFQHVAIPQTRTRQSPISVCGNTTDKSAGKHHALYAEITHQNSSKSNAKITLSTQTQNAVDNDEEHWKESYKKELDMFPLSPEKRDRVFQNALKQRKDAQCFNNKPQEVN